MVNWGSLKDMSIRERDWSTGTKLHLYEKCESQCSVAVVWLTYITIIYCIFQSKRIILIPKNVNVYTAENNSNPDLAPHIVHASTNIKIHSVNTWSYIVTIKIRTLNRTTSPGMTLLDQRQRSAAFLPALPLYVYLYNSKFLTSVSQTHILQGRCSEVSAG